METNISENRLNLFSDFLKQFDYTAEEIWTILAKKYDIIDGYLSAQIKKGSPLLIQVSDHNED